MHEKLTGAGSRAMGNRNDITLFLFCYFSGSIDTQGFVVYVFGTGRTLHNLRQPANALIIIHLNEMECLREITLGWFILADLYRSLRTEG